MPRTGQRNDGSGKIRLAILFGGRSCEHEVSVTSARSMLAAMNTQRYDITLVGIDKAGQWLTASEPAALLEAGEISGAGLTPVSLPAHAGAPGSGAPAQGTLTPDVVFPLLHGTYGEDGTIQGLLELAGVAYVGSGVLGSSVGMDKEMAKRVLAAEGIPQVPWRAIPRHQWRSDPDAVIESLRQEFSGNLFVKPANLGSSVGVSRVTDEASLRVALDHASEFDVKMIVEAAAENCHEVECAVLGNDHPEASIPGEIIPAAEFYDYRDKYIDGRSRAEIPAVISQASAGKVRDLSVKVFQAVGALGLARVDFFVERDGDGVFVNEINTMPGFTPISMYPKLWEASGLAYPDLVDRLVDLALERQHDRADLKTSL